MDPWERRGPVRLSWSPARARGGGFGEIGLCKSRLGEIIPVKSLANLSLSFVGKDKKIDDSLQRCRKRRTIFRTQPALGTQNSKAFFEDRDPDEWAVAGWDWASTSCSGGVL